MDSSAQHRTPRDVAAVVEQFNAYVLGASFPCLGARAAVNSGRAHFGSYGRLGGAGFQDQQLICNELASFSAAYAEPCEAPATYVALFDDDVRSEEDFERRLWRHLQRMHACDRLTSDWARTVSSDPESSNFSFSIAGRAFFVVGLHPRASRIARRAPVPCLVFNFHDQFEQLRASGKYAKMQRLIRARDVALQGDANPVLSAFGDASEARQYSGRIVYANWRCPFHAGASHVR